MTEYEIINDALVLSHEHNYIIHKDVFTDIEGLPYMPVGDLDVLSGIGQKTFEDRITSAKITIVPLPDGTPPEPLINIVFGSDDSENGNLNADGILVSALLGTDDIDRIYGGFGDDDIPF